MISPYIKLVSLTIRCEMYFVAMKLEKRRLSPICVHLRGVCWCLNAFLF